MCSLKIRQANKQKPNRHRHRMVATRGVGVGVGEEGKGVTYVVTEGDWALGGEHTMQ